MGENYNALSYQEKQEFKRCNKRFLELTKEANNEET
jgi:hypothetical protein